MSALLWKVRIVLGWDWVKGDTNKINWYKSLRKWETPQQRDIWYVKSCICWVRQNHFLIRNHFGRGLKEFWLLQLWWGWPGQDPRPPGMLFLSGLHGQDFPSSPVASHAVCLVPYCCHNSLSQIYWPETASMVCRLKSLWVQLGSLSGSHKAKVLAQLGSSLEALRKNPFPSLLWLLAESGFCICRTKILISFLATSQGLLSALRAPCILSHVAPPPSVSQEWYSDSFPCFACLTSPLCLPLLPPATEPSLF